MTQRKPAPWVAAILLLGLVFSLHAQPVATAAGRDASIYDMQIHYQDIGQGEVLLLLHGFGGCGRDWQVFMDRFAPHFRLIVPDLRGHGASTNPLGTFTHRQAASDVMALMDHLGIRRFKAIGISSGGMTLMHMATRSPERIEAMVLVGSSSHFPDQARAITGRAAREGPRPGDLQYFRQCATRGEAQVQQLATQFAAFSTSHDDVDFSRSLLATIRARTLIVSGDRDEFFPVSIPVEMYRAIPHSALWIVPDAPHVPIFGVHEGAFGDTALRFLQPAR